MASEADTLERWFAVADANRDGRIDGSEANNFFHRSGLPRETLKEVWGRTAGTQSFMTKQQFYGAIRLVSLAQLSGGGFTAVQAQQMLAGTSPPPPLPKMTGLTPGTWTPPSTSPTYQATGGGTFQPPSMQYTGGSLPAGPTVQVTGQVPPQYTGGRPEPQFPPLPMEEAMRYGQLFQSLDTDRDGFVQGGHCIEMFSSRGVDRGVLKQIWQVVAGNAGQINRDQFVKCLYLIETSKQGIPVPVALPSGPFPTIVQGSSAMAATQIYNPTGVPNLPSKAVFQAPDPSAYPGWRGPAANEGMVSTLDVAQRDRLMAEKMEAHKKDHQLYMMDQEAETVRSKKEFYEKALQELMLFKSRMDVASMEVQEKLKREKESAADAERRYEQIRTGAEEAAREAGSFALSLQETQNRKAEMEMKLNEMQQSLATRERSHPELVRQLETEIQTLQQSVASVELRRNALMAELESYRHQQDLLSRRQGDLQMACAAADAEVHSASGDIDKIMSQIESTKESRDAEQIQKLLREAARVYSNLHSHACKAGVEIPVEARLSLYGDDIAWADDLIGAGVDVSAWQEDGFVLVDAFPDVKEDMDIEFEKAIQEAVQNIKQNETEKLPMSGGVDAFGGGGAFGDADPFASLTAPETKTSEFVAFDAFPSIDASPAPTSPVPAQTMVPAFAVSFDNPSEDVPVFQQPSNPPAFVAFDDAPVVPEKPQAIPSEGFVVDFEDFSNPFPAVTEPPTSTAPPNKETTITTDFFGDNAFP